MAKIRDGRPPTARAAAGHQAEAEKIAAELAAIAATGMVLPGSITQRRTRCGHPRCGCHADPPRLHGPYWQWTRKVAARTVCRWLSPDQQHDYQAWIDNDRRLRELLARLEALGAAALEADPRGHRRPRAAPPKPDRPPHNTVSKARLTCGQPSSPPPFPQVIPKHEDLSQVRQGFAAIESGPVDGLFRCAAARQAMAVWQFSMTLSALVGLARHREFCVPQAGKSLVPTQLRPPVLGTPRRDARR